MKFLILLTLIFAAFAASGAGQNGLAITGTVYDVSGPAEGATVTLTAVGESTTKYITTTNGEGSFSFQAGPGRYLITATRRLNAVTQDADPKEVEVRPGKPVTIELRFGNIPAIRETVSISADLEQPIDEVSKTVDVIQGREMRERADFTLVESLRSIPGIRVQQLGGFGRTASIKTRGLRNQDTAILVDGVRFRDATSIAGDATPFLGDITLTSVSRVDVLRGSGSSLYGTNAIGGTVDLITPEPRPGTHGQVSYAVGQLGLHRFRGNISDAYFDGKFGFNFAVARTAYTKGIDGDDDAQNTNVQSRLEFKPTSRTGISARFFVSDAYVRLNTNPDTLGDPPPTNAGIIDARPGSNLAVDSNDPFANQKTRAFNDQLVVTRSLGERASLSAYYSGLATERRNEDGPPISLNTSIFEGSLHTLNTTLNWSPLDGHIFKAGYEFELENYGNRGLTPGGSGDFDVAARQRSHTIFVQDIAGFFNDSLKLSGGFRAQFFNISQPVLSLGTLYADASLNTADPAITFDGAVSYFVRRTGTKFRAHAGNGYRVPSLYERLGSFFSTFPDPAFIAIGDPGLRPERSFAFDAGIEQQFADRRVVLSATYFYTRLTDIIGYGNVVADIGSTPRPFGGYVNQEGGIARGGEFSARLAPTRSTDLFASYTFTNSDQSTPQVSGSGITQSLGIPEHQFTLVATQRIERFWVTLDVLLASDYLAPIFSNSTFNSYIYRFDGNRRADVTAGYTFPLGADRFSLRLFATVENLLDDDYLENGFRTPGRNARVGISFGF